MGRCYWVHPLNQPLGCDVAAPSVTECWADRCVKGKGDDVETVTLPHCYVALIGLSYSCHSTTSLFHSLLIAHISAQTEPCHLHTSPSSPGGKVTALYRLALKPCHCGLWTSPALWSLGPGTMPLSHVILKPASPSLILKSRHTPSPSGPGRPSSPVHTFSFSGLGKPSQPSPLAILALEPEILVVRFDPAKKVIITGGNDRIIKVCAWGGCWDMGNKFLVNEVCENVH